MSPSSLLPCSRRRFVRRGSAAGRAALLLSALAAVLVAGCSDADEPDRSGSNEGKATASAPTGASFPPNPPAAAGCAGKTLDHRDIQHPDLGPVRVYLVRRPASEQPAGCVTAVTGSGRALAPVEVDANWTMEGALRFAAPATDSTKNVFVTYNPGRYDGVLVLVPTADGFADIGWKSADDYYSGGRFAFYYARPVGPGEDGEYAIVHSIKGCDPSCAEGATSKVILRWDGRDYLPTG
ncbi:hypothetical protein SAM40697_5197 [Streptomyces ambofaciens]|uniref:Secreted protein n=1 Tax=Streptomyces ambofaciens TaxID=1889 RepID=A0ABM6B5M3_STRAM|nr:hypothetical protein [Streptomyces ambofaciens]ANB09153.1 hypothetical protein SAM40697_5197 [Streptomyces ambofaciens]